LKRGKTFFSKEKSTMLDPKKKKRIIVIILVIAVVFGLIVMRKGKNNTQVVIAEDTVTRGNIVSTITGSAAVEPLERFEIIPKVSGDIVYCPYEVGDSVAEDDILYMFDTSDTDLTVERQRISMQQSENTYKDALEESEKLYITAKNSGVISGLGVNEGQEVTAGVKIATVEDTRNLQVEVPFTGSQIDAIYVGDSAIVTSSKHTDMITGTVTHKSSSSYVGNDGVALYNVVIEFNNPGAFYSGMEVGASVNGNISPGKGIISYRYSSTSSTETDGTVISINYKNGDYVDKGDVIVVLESDTITDRINNSTLSYKSAQISMQQTEKTLEDYNITSPINGTVITKNSKAGDTIDRTNSATTLMVVADISKLKFELAIDELDVNKVSEGQEVSITCDALPGERFVGIITNVSVEGTAANGVTTYAAEVVIDEPGNLRPSMNVDAEIIIESVENVLRVPTECVRTAGGKKYVFVKGKGTGSKGSPDANSKVPQAPEGYVVREIEVGISNGDYTEVTKGLSEGEIVYKSTIVTLSQNSMMPSGGMGGGMSGGMGGGMPNGGMGGMSGGASRGGMRQ